MSTGQTLVSQCDHCGGLIEITIAQVGGNGRCYHCGLETTLNPSIHLESGAIESRLPANPVKRVRNMLIVIAAVALLWNLVFLALLLMPEGEKKLLHLMNRAIPW